MMVTTAQAPTTLITSIEFEEMFGDDVRVELWRGVVVEMSPTKPTHGKIGIRLTLALGGYAMQTGLGEFWPEGSGFTILSQPDTVVAPDLSFIPADVAPTLTDENPGFPFFVPPLVVEIKSPSDSEPQITAKLSLYYAAGVREIWWVRPMPRTLTRYWADRDPVTLGLGDVLGDVEALPGFSMTVDDMFPPEQPTGGTA